LYSRTSREIMIHTWSRRARHNGGRDRRRVISRKAKHEGEDPMSRFLGLCAALAFALAIALSNSAGAKVGAACGGFVINPGVCGLNEFCQRAPGKCFIFDLPGKCAFKPEVCFFRKGVFYIPECGCDGVTYRNDCERRKAGVSLAHKGKC
jgi:hypothetical protein